MVYVPLNAGSSFFGSSAAQCVFSSVFKSDNNFKKEIQTLSDIQVLFVVTDFLSQKSQLLSNSTDTNI